MIADKYINHKINTGYVNWKNSLDFIDIKDMNTVINLEIINQKHLDK